MVAMNALAKKFLTQDEQDRVTQAVKQAELQTSGEIVPMIVSYSHDYPRAIFLATMMYSLILTYALAHVLSTTLWIDFFNIHYFFLLFAPLFFIFFWIVSTYRALARMFISKDQMAAEVEEEATKSFFIERLYETKENNGILLFISVFEKKAWILADRGINERIDQTEWQEIVDTLTGEIRKNNRGDGICAAVERIGAILKDYFPYQRDDTDELHNLIIK
jgi:putative membrane protein